MSSRARDLVVVGASAGGRHGSAAGDPGRAVRAGRMRDRVPERGGAGGTLARRHERGSEETHGAAEVPRERLTSLPARGERS